MATPQQQPFGRRGQIKRPPPPSSRAAGPADLRPNLPPEVVAAVMTGSNGARALAQASAMSVTRVAWSFRAAVLAGLIVGLFNAAARATSFLSFGSLGVLGKIPLGSFGARQISLGQADMPLTVLIALAGLWSGARASALSLLFAHKALARMGQTSLMAYSLGGAAACLGYAFIASLFGGETTPASIVMEAVSGFGAGFFYRLFAATERG